MHYEILHNYYYNLINDHNIVLFFVKILFIEIIQLKLKNTICSTSP